MGSNPTLSAIKIRTARLFRDGVVLRDTPHPDDLLLPGVEGLGELNQGLQTLGLETFDRPEKAKDQVSALSLGSLFDEEQTTQALLEETRISERGMSSKVLPELRVHDWLAPWDRRPPSRPGTSR